MNHFFTIFIGVRGKGIDSRYSAHLYLRVLCNQIAHLDRRRKIDQMNKLETLDHTALKLVQLHCMGR